MITSIIGILAVTPRSETEHGMRAINRGFFISAAISAAAVFAISAIYMDDLRPAVAVLLGLILASIIQILTQYFTDTKFKPVQEIAESTQTGPATTILSGFSIGLESTVWSVLIIAAVISGAYVLGDGTLEGAVLHLAHRHGDAHDGGRDRVDGHLRAGVGQRAGDRRDVGRVRGSSGAGAHRPRRRRELDEGDHRGWRSQPR